MRVAALGICAILLAAAWASRQRTTGDRLESGGLAPFDERWLTFRDGWGAFWGLRVLNRINETAELSALARAIGVGRVRSESTDRGGAGSDR